MATTAGIAKGTNGRITAQPRLHQRAAEIQRYGTVTPMLPLDLEEPVRLEMTEQLNQIAADTMTLRDLYKKSHWQVAGPTFYQLHLLFDKHFGEQADLVDAIAGFDLCFLSDWKEAGSICLDRIFPRWDIGENRLAVGSRGYARDLLAFGRRHANIDYACKGGII